MSEKGLSKVKKRYALVALNNKKGGEDEVLGYLSTKKQLDSWFDEKYEEDSINWRVGYMVKLYNSDRTYGWFLMQKLVSM